MKKEIYTHQHDSIQCLSQLIYPENLNKSTPVVLIFPNWMGLTEKTIQKAEEIAKLGYIGFAVDIYGEGKHAKNADEAERLMKPYISDIKFLRARCDSAFKAAQSINPSVAAIGFCFGGRCVIELLRTGVELKGAISVHGVLKNITPQEKSPAQLHGSLLILHGIKDPFSPLDDVIELQNEMSEAKLDWQTHIFSLAGHGFTDEQLQNVASGNYFESKSNARSSQLIKNFLKEVLT